MHKNVDGPKPRETPTERHDVVAACDLTAFPTASGPESFELAFFVSAQQEIHF